KTARHCGFSRDVGWFVQVCPTRREKRSSGRRRDARAGQIYIDQPAAVVADRNGQGLRQRGQGGVGVVQGQRAQDPEPGGGGGNAQVAAPVGAQRLDHRVQRFVLHHQHADRKSVV